MGSSGHLESSQKGVVACHGHAWCSPAVAPRADECRATCLHEEPLRASLEHDGRGPGEVVQLEPRLHPLDYRAAHLDVYSELPHERGHTYSDEDARPNGHREGQVRPEVVRQLSACARSTVQTRARLLMDS